MFSYDKALAITNRHLCSGDFLDQVAKVAACHPVAMVLREKDLTPKAYKALAEKVVPLGDKEGVTVILHSFYGVARELGHQKIHLPLPVLRQMTVEDKAFFMVIGASTHSVEEALEAQALGATYITAGHVFATDCKKGVPPRGIPFLETVVEAVEIPVYALGGINAQNGALALAAGAAGICMMSGFMRL